VDGVLNLSLNKLKESKVYIDTGGCIIGLSNLRLLVDTSKVSINSE
jgi:hypothetical protein